MANEQIFTATFIGEDGSLGYKTNQRYTIIVKQGVGRKINIKRKITEDGECPYDSFEAFLRNWDDIKHFSR